MKKFLLPGIILTVLLLLGGSFLFSKNSSDPSSNQPSTPPFPSSHEYFWGDGCPHCENVAKFFETWNKKDAVAVDKKEVWSNKENNNLMLARAKYCGIKPSDLGVPFLFTPEGKCLSGDELIIEYFKSLEI